MNLEPSNIAPANRVAAEVTSLFSVMYLKPASLRQLLRPTPRIRTNTPIASVVFLFLLVLSFAPGGTRAAELDAKNWQFFIDYYAIARGTGLDRVVHHPKPMGVVIDADKPWETHGVQPAYFTRKADGTFLGYYHAHWWIPNTDARSASMRDVVYDNGSWRTRLPDKRPQDRDQQYVGIGAYATSKDGIHWEKPNLGLIDAPSGTDWKKFPPFAHPTGSSRDNNADYPFTIVDLDQYGNVSDPAKRYAIHLDGQAYFAAELPDFIHDREWRAKLVKADGVFSPRWNHLNFWDQQHQEWVAIVQNAVPHWLPTREIARFSSPDLKHWNSEIVLTPDPEDPHAHEREQTSEGGLGRRAFEHAL